ncbi:hypothetical protein AVEN_120262-1 [Araneus ventricosus]|uniref:Uncharacterized protein n=1 Tax=Araneus ventricosus TaxID=182803 RepID=A0A4Y2DN66_ARAVE|nr:hypothetical protein AVEN_120262-1 [Araneus ventricosus]
MTGASFEVDAFAHKLPPNSYWITPKSFSPRLWRYGVENTRDKRQRNPLFRGPIVFVRHRPFVSRLTWCARWATFVFSLSGIMGSHYPIEMRQEWWLGSLSPFEGQSKNKRL